MLSEHVDANDVLLFITDAAPYMVKAGFALGVIYQKIIHVACVAHVLYTVAEEVSSCSQNVDDLISNMKKVFAKSLMRVQLFKGLPPDVALPPQPVLTRWGT